MGPTGDRGPAGSGSGFQVIDQKGTPVGTVGKASPGSANVFLEVNSDLFAFDINAAGFAVTSYGGAALTNESFLYATPDCTGTKYTTSNGYYGSYGVSTPSPTDLAIGAVVDPTGQAFFARPSELKAQQYYALSEVAGLNDAAAMTSCTTATTQGTTCPDAGTVVGSPHTCAAREKNNLTSCVTCCRPNATLDQTRTMCILNASEQEAPVHQMSVDGLGFTPPFHLQP